MFLPTITLVYILDSGVVTIQDHTTCVEEANYLYKQVVELWPDKTPPSVTMECIYKNEAGAIVDKEVLVQSHKKTLEDDRRTNEERAR
jgi:hypothetical protein